MKISIEDITTEVGKPTVKRVEMSLSDYEGDIDEGSVLCTLSKSNATLLAKGICNLIGYTMSPTMAKVCPECGSHDVHIFDSDDDICNNCKKYFPVVKLTDLSDKPLGE